MKRLLIIGNYGAQNFGDDAMLSVLVGFLRNHFHLTVFTVFRRKEVHAAYNVPSVSISTPVRLLLAIFRADWILVGGGSLIKNFSMLKLSPIFLICLALRKRFAFFGVQIHKLHPLLRLLFLALLKRSELIYTRSSIGTETTSILGQSSSMPDITYALASLGYPEKRRYW